MKIIEFEELLNVPHSVFIVEGAGSGKTEVWWDLTRTYDSQGKPCNYIDLNPKAITNNELYRFLNPTTRDCHDGLLSVIMWNLTVLTNENPKWIVLEVDIDPIDHNAHTLSSNERISLNTYEKVIFEISHMNSWNTSHSIKSRHFIY
jgi:dynein heavy chain